ncbi:glycosyltransferase family 2 protein [Phenylobacterium sp.]|uniref:glycosyltransferase family 2 protein n=1 Tax=Phenylobacterium sp. TaxID=1871053 RepID=UPI0027304283|nr:glycosyltransferase family 2 protein [Phenylobacterium sp.]MDP1597886.1 glycosyltransferase family 2 protein [Phenylobacterium sp.]MDP3593098.1 glycosyltransferase family 2 protein [Phenylobacterium sp.]
MDERAQEDKAQAPTITVCIIAYNSGPTLRTCLERLAGQTFQDFETLVIDNASPDPGDAAIAREFPFVQLIENSENLGFAGAGNQGARLARGRWYVLLNPDAFAQPNWLEELAGAAERYPNLLSFTSRQLMDEDPGLLDGLGDVMSGYGIPYRGGYLSRDPGDTPEGEVFSPCGAAMMIDRALFLKLGGFDEFFFCYSEDVDLGYRLQLSGEPTLLVPSAVIRHVGSASTGGRKSEFAVFHGTRNRFYVVYKDTPAILLPVVVPLHLMGVVYISSRRENWPHAHIVWRAFKESLKGLPTILKSRRAVQRARRASAWEIAKAMTWNPRDLTGRRPVIRPLRPSRSTAP